MSEELEEDVLEAINGYEAVNYNEVTYEFLRRKVKEKSAFMIKPEEELFKKGVLVDLFTASGLVTILDALKLENKQKWDTVIIQDQYKLANFFDKMWDWLK